VPKGTGKPDGIINALGNCQKFYEKKEIIWNHRGPRETLCVLKKRRSKDRDIARWKINSLVEDEVVFRDRGINHLEGTEGRE
jgi:hypothetical protein